MTTKRVVLKDLTDSQEAIAEAARLLAAGELVVFPTETVYGLAVNADDAAAVARLYEAKGRPAVKPLTIHLADAAEAGGYIEPPRGRVRRLMARGWPGPLTLVFPRRPGAPGEPGTGPETVGLRVPDHDVARQVLREARVPVAASSANRSGNAAPTTGEEVMRNVGEAAALVLDGGPTRFGRGSTVVRVDGEQFHIVRPGTVSARSIDRLASFRVAFVCSGNTCRSPMAEAIARRLLARRLKVPSAQLLAAGFEVRSMGTGAVAGAPASEMAIAAMKQVGYDVGDHLSQPATEAEVAQSDLIFTMTEAQRESLGAKSPASADRIHRLDPERDIPDPVGGSMDMFRECAAAIERAVAERLDLILDAAEA